MRKRLIAGGLTVVTLAIVLALSLSTVGPVLANSTVYADSVSCTDGTCTSPSGAIDTNDGTYGTFDKASGPGTALTMIYTFGQTLTPATGSAITVYFDFDKLSQDPWCQFYWNSFVGDGYTATTTLTNAGRYTTSFSLPSSTDLYSVEVNCSGNNSAQTDHVYYIKADYLEPTATTTATPTFTATATATATATFTGTPAVVTFGGNRNYLQDGSLETYPFLNPIGLSPWASSWNNGTVARQIFSAPEYWQSSIPVSPVCGDSFWELDPSPGVMPQPGQVPEPGVFDHTGPYAEQGFDWPGGDMYVSFAAQTSDVNTGAYAQMMKPDSSVAIFNTDIANLSGWQFFHYKITSAPTGHYTLQFEGFTTSGTKGGRVALDAIGVHEGYYVNDCNAPQALWGLDQSQAIFTSTPSASGPTATINYAQATVDSGTRIAQANSTANAGATSTRVAGATSTQVAGVTATHNSVALTQGWITATSIGNGVATLIASGNSTHVAEAHGTQTEVAGGITSTAIHVATATAFVGNVRGTWTAVAAGTATAAVALQTQNAAVFATAFAQQTQTAGNRTATAAAHLTQTEAAAQQPPVIYQLTLQSINATQLARLMETNAAVLTQQAGALATANAQLTAAPNATNEAQATAIAQVQQTLQALATVAATQSLGATATAQAQSGGQTDTTMPPLTSYSYDEGCERPTNVLNIPAWIDYEVCRVESWVTWGPQNTATFAGLVNVVQSHEPFSTMAQLQHFLSSFQTLIGNVDWNTGPGCANAAPDPAAFLARARGILLGQFSFDSNPVAFSDTCQLAAADIIGPFITRAICILINLLCALGILPYFQWISNTVATIAFVVYLKRNVVDKAIV